MMNRVHPRCNQELIERLINTLGKANITVVEECTDLKNEFIKQEHFESRTYENDLANTEDGGIGHFTKVEAKTG